MKNIPTEKSIIDQTRKYLKENGTYNPSDNRILGVYASTMYQFYTLQKEWEDEGYQTQVISGQNSVKKNPRLDQLNTLRKDIISLSDRLMLNPKSRVNDSPKAGGTNELMNFLTKSGM